MANELQYQMNAQSIYIRFILIFAIWAILSFSSPLMIEEKEEFLEKIKAKNIAVLYYGDNQSPQFQQYQQLIPRSNELFEGLQFLYVPASKFKLNRPNPSLSIYRKIGGGDWQTYRGNFNRYDMDKWIRSNIGDPLKQLTIEHLQLMFRQHKKGFILLSYGQFQLIRTKIYIHDFCTFKGIKCWKVETTSPIYSVAVKLMGVEKTDEGTSKLAFYNAENDRMQLYTHDVWMIKREELLEMYEGRQGIIHSQTPDGEVQIELHYQQAEEI